MSNTPPIPGQQSAGDKAGSSPPDVNVAPKSTAGNDNPPSKIFPVRAGQVGGGEPSGSRLYKSVAAGRSAGGEPSGSRPDTGFAASDDVSDHDSDIEIITDRPLLSQTLDDLMSGKQSRDKGKGRAFEGPPRPSEGPQRPHDPVARQEALVSRMPSVNLVNHAANSTIGIQTRQNGAQRERAGCQPCANCTGSKYRRVSVVRGPFRVQTLTDLAAYATWNWGTPRNSSQAKDQKKRSSRARSRCPPSKPARARQAGLGHSSRTINSARS